MNPHILSHEQVLDCLRVKHFQMIDRLDVLASELLNQDHGLSDLAFQRLVSLCNLIDAGLAQKIRRRATYNGVGWYYINTGEDQA